MPNMAMGPYLIGPYGGGRDLEVAWLDLNMAISVTEVFKWLDLFHPVLILPPFTIVLKISSFALDSSLIR